MEGNGLREVRGLRGKGKEVLGKDEKVELPIELVRVDFSYLFIRAG